MHRRPWHLNATHLSTMSRTQTPPTALTPAVQRRPVAVARRATPRRIHGVRLAIAATARSERRIAVRGPGVGVDTSSASADPAGGPWRSTASLAVLNTHGLGIVAGSSVASGQGAAVKPVGRQRRPLLRSGDRGRERGGGTRE